MDLLLLLQVAGILTAGILGVIGIKAETHEEIELPPAAPGGPPIKTKRLTKAGKLALGITILSALTALGAVIGDQIKSRDASRQAEAQEQNLRQQLNTLQQKLDAQLMLAQDATVATDRMFSRLTSFTMDLLLELPGNSSLFDKDRAALTAYFEANRPRLNRDIEEVPNSSGISTGRIHWVIEKGKVEWIHVPYRTKECWEVFPHLAGFGDEPCLSKMFNFRSDVVINRSSTNWLPRFVGTSSKPPRLPDFLASGSDDQKATLAFNFTSGRMLMSVRDITFPESRWRTNGAVISTVDLAGAQFALLVSNLQLCEQVAPDIKVLRANLNWGKNRMSISQFTFITNEAMSAYVATLPERAKLFASDPSEDWLF
jgi:hypothetical protein